MVVPRHDLARAFLSRFCPELTINQDMKALKLFVTDIAELLAACLVRHLNRGCWTRPPGHHTAPVDWISDVVEQFPGTLPPLPEQRRIIARWTNSWRYAMTWRRSSKPGAITRTRLHAAKI